MISGGGWLEKHGSTGRSQAMWALRRSRKRVARSAGCIGAGRVPSSYVRLRQTVVEWVDQARRHSAWSQAFYLQQKRAGKSHTKAIRALAYKWGRILWRCWQDRVPYDEETYLAALRRKKSPLVKLLGIAETAQQPAQTE